MRTEFAFWPLRRDDHSGVLSGTGGTHDNRSFTRARGAIDCKRVGLSGSSHVTALVN